MAHFADRRAFVRHLTPVRKKRWVVYAKAPFAGPEAVLAYRSRYTHRAAISNRRLIAFDGFVTATQPSYNASQDGRRLGGHRHCVPLLHRLGSEEAQRGAGDQMALNIERVVDGGMHGEEALSRSC
jgi:hypothetical protein